MLSYRQKFYYNKNFRTQRQIIEQAYAELIGKEEFYKSLLQ